MWDCRWASDQMSARFKMFTGSMLMSHRTQQPMDNGLLLSGLGQDKDCRLHRRLDLFEECCYPIVISLQKLHLLHNGLCWYLQTVDYSLSDKNLAESQWTDAVPNPVKFKNATRRRPPRPHRLSRSSLNTAASWHPDRHRRR